MSSAVVIGLFARGTRGRVTLSSDCDVDTILGRNSATQQLIFKNSDSRFNTGESLMIEVDDDDDGEVEDGGENDDLFQHACPSHNRPDKPFNANTLTFLFHKCKYLCKCSRHLQRTQSLTPLTSKREMNSHEI